MTLQQLIDQSAFLIGLVESGQSLDATESADALRALNQMLSKWSVEDMDLKYPPQDTLTDTYPLQLWTEYPVVYNLALRLGALFNMPVPVDVAFIAEQGKRLVAKNLINNKTQPLDMTHMPGAGFSGYILSTSADTTVTPASVWAELSSGTTEHLRSIYYEGGLWVVCGDNGTILTSDDDGDSWVSRTSGTTYSLRTVKYWNSTWWIVGHGHSSGHTVLKSSDAITWTPVTVPSLSAASLVTIGFTDSQMLFGGWQWPFAGANACIVETTDGSSFTVNQYSFYGVYGIETDGSTYLIVGSNASDDSTGYMASSTDGTTLSTISTHGFTYSIWTAVYSGSNWVCGTGNGEIKYSSDLSTWTAGSAPDAVGENIWRITTSNRGVLIAAGGFNDGWLLRSLNLGKTWVNVYENENPSLMSKAWYSGSFWIAVGWSGYIVKSTS